MDMHRRIAPSRLTNQTVTNQSVDLSLSHTRFLPLFLSLSLSHTHTCLSLKSESYVVIRVCVMLSSNFEGFQRFLRRHYLLEMTVDCVCLEAGKSIEKSKAYSQPRGPSLTPEPSQSLNRARIGSVDSETSLFIRGIRVKKDRILLPLPLASTVVSNFILSRDTIVILPPPPNGKVLGISLGSCLPLHTSPSLLSGYLD